jgi:hypothetical protein
LFLSFNNILPNLLCLEYDTVDECDRHDECRWKRPVTENPTIEQVAEQLSEEVAEQVAEKVAEQLSEELDLNQNNDEVIFP